MGRLLRFIFLAICLGLGWQFLQDKFDLKAQLPLQQTQCPLPLSWRLGALDPEFGFTREQAIAAIEDAAAIWNHALGQTVLQQDQQHGFLIDFRFDQRQQQLLTQRLLERNLARYDDAIQPSTDRLSAQFADLTQQIEDYNQQQAQLRLDIQQYENSQHKNEQQRQQLLKRQQRLQHDADYLEQQQQALQREQVYLNETIQQRNELLAQYKPNATGPFEVGLLEIRGNVRRMTIFAFSSHQDLTATLVHEFGHAFGVAHTAEPDSIMHHSLNASQQQLTAADLAAFSAVCSLQ